MSLGDLLGAAADLNSAIEILREWAVGDDVDCIMAVPLLLRTFGQATIYVADEFVADSLGNAGRHGEECYRNVASEFIGHAISGVYSGAPGQPSPRLLADKEIASNLVQKYESRPFARRFFTSLVQHAEDSIKREVAYDEEADMS